MKTFLMRKEDVKPQWFLVNAEGATLGRLATKLADVLRGKNKPTFTPSVSMGDVVVVVNAEKIVLTGNKLKDKMYRHHTGYPRGLREIAAGDLLAKHPDRLIRDAVYGMLPKNKLREHMIRKLKVYKGTEHPHAAQLPVPLVF
jgi:large subunit ribosomal protein L13